MKGTMKVAMMNEPGRFDFEEKPIPEVKPGYVLVKLDYVGICGSDMHLFRHGFIGESYVTEPMVLGHEPAGTVAEVGEGVTDLKVGDRVAVEPGIPDWTCDFARAGDTIYVPTFIFMHRCRWWKVALQNILHTRQIYAISCRTMSARWKER